MGPSDEVKVRIAYKSRGLEHLRYIPKRMCQTGHYRVSMNIAGIPPDKLDYPIGSMPAAEALSSFRSDTYTLTWKLDNALTSYDIGIKLPVAEQPNYHFSNLLGEAPVGLVMLVVLLTVPRMLMGKPVRADIVAVMGIAYCIHYTFMGRLADVMPSFEWPFAISCTVLVGVMSWLRLSDSGLAVLKRQDAVAFAIMAIVYPLIIVDSEQTNVLMQYLYVLMLVYMCVLIICYRFRRRECSAGS